MKLFLSSLTPTQPAHGSHLAHLVGKQPIDITIALIANAADKTKPEEWARQKQKALQSHGFQVDMVDLNQYKDKPEALKKELSSKDVIWLGGGNTYYLRWILKETGADTMLKELVTQGTVLGGDSAGAIVAGPTLKHFEVADDPNVALEIILEGLNLTDKVVVPHMDNEKFKAVIHSINDKLKAEGYKTTPLTDAQALVVDGDEEMVV